MELKNTDIVKKEPLEIERVYSKIDLLNRLLDNPDKKELLKKITAWWEVLDNKWQEVFLFNLEWARNLTQTQIRHNMQYAVEPHHRYFQILKKKFDAKKIEINDDTLLEIYNLRTIDCQYFDLKDIEPLRFLPNLEYLDCSLNDIISLEPLRGKTSLLKLDVNTNLQLLDIDVINALPNLKILWLYRVRAKSIIFTELLQNIEILLIDDIRITNPNILEKFINLKIIACKDLNAIVEISKNKFPKLKIIFASYHLKDKINSQDLKLLKSNNPNVEIRFSNWQFSISYIEEYLSKEIS